MKAAYLYYYMYKAIAIKTTMGLKFVELITQRDARSSATARLDAKELS